jgi:hypothetical protein
MMLVLSIVSLPANAARGEPDDVGGIPEEKAFKEDALKLPPYPPDASLVEIHPRGNSSNRFYVDIDSLSLGEDRVVRYTMVVKTRSGVANVSYEGLRCKDAHYKVYAFGTREAAWAASRNSDWKYVESSDGNFRFSLIKDYFCDSEAVAGRNARDLRLQVRNDFPQKSNTTKR